MSGRRERPLTGRSNYSASPQVSARGAEASPRTRAQSASAQRRSVDNSLRSTYSSARGDNSARRDNSRPSSSAGMAFTQTRQMSNRSDSDFSTTEMLRRMKDRQSFDAIQKENEEAEKLGDFSAFSRPVPSLTQPLRSVFLDPEVNNFPRSRTRTELMKRIKMSGTPHPSFDLDRDGYVSQADYRLAKQFDFNGNGVLDPEERKIGQTILADQFFKRHENDLHNFGPTIASRDHKSNVSSLVNSFNFERAYEQLSSVERTLTAGSSKPILDCMQSQGRGVADLLKHNFYTNKFDTTAWNDSDAVPRATMNRSLTEHGGSRKRLMFARKETERLFLGEKMQTFQNSRPPIHTRRVNLITDVAKENA